MSLVITKNRASQFGSTRTIEVWNKTRGKCGYCGIVLEANDTDKDVPNMFTIDHIIPRSKGGSKDISNLLASCRVCNNLKGNSGNLDFLRMKLLINEGKLIKFNEAQFDFLFTRGINLGKLRKYEFYFEKLGIKS